MSDTKTTHTPGPWRIERRTHNEPTMPFGKFKDVKKLCVGSGAGTLDDPFHIVHETYDNGEIDPDTRLIAAAVNSYDKHCGPRAVECAEADLLGELLEALQCFLRTWKSAGPQGSHQFEKFDTAVRLAEIAIAKATGEQ